MKGLVLATCVGSAAAVVAPQFQNAFYASGGPCSCVVERPYSMCVATMPPNVNGYFSTNAGFCPSDFVVTDVVVGTDNIINNSNEVAEVVRVLANGIAVCTTATHEVGYGYGVTRSGASAHFQHGVVIPAGHQIRVESYDKRAFVTLSGYLK